MIIALSDNGGRRLEGDRRLLFEEDYWPERRHAPDRRVAGDRRKKLKHISEDHGENGLVRRGIDSLKNSDL